MDLDVNGALRLGHAGEVVLLKPISLVAQPEAHKQAHMIAELRRLPKIAMLDQRIAAFANHVKAGLA